MLYEINEQRPDLVVFNGLGYRLAHWLVLHSRHRFRIAFIAAGINVEPLLPFADYILAETPQQMDDFFAAAKAAGRSAILPKLLAPAPSCPDAEKIFDIINIGTFNTNKNQRALLPLSSLYRVALLGDGPLWSDVHAMTRSCHSSVFMPGNLPRDEVAKVLSKSHLMVHTAIQEGLPRVVMEAFAHGIPVIGSKDAMPGAFEDGIQGLLVKQEHILDAARELLSDPSRLQKMGEAARAYARTHCSESAVWATASKMYDTVLQQPPVFRGTAIDRARLRADVAKRNSVEWLARHYRNSGAKKLMRHLKSTP
jgi:glycosyltransferase involved in cell wall biosynthesis